MHVKTLQTALHASAQWNRMHGPHGHHMSSKHPLSLPLTLVTLVLPCEFTSHNTSHSTVGAQTATASTRHIMSHHVTAHVPAQLCSVTFRLKNIGSGPASHKRQSCSQNICHQIKHATQLHQWPPLNVHHHHQFHYLTCSYL